MANPPVVLIHGSWMGGWAWDGVRSRLRAEGIVSLAPTLTGCGDRHHLATPRTGLETHVADIRSFLEFVDDENVILVGHSYGGAVATEIAAACPERVRSVVLLDGCLAEAGKSLNETYPEFNAMLASLIDADHPHLIQPAPVSLLGMDENAGTARTARYLRPMPTASNDTPARHSATGLGGSRHYVRFTRFPVFERSARLARESGWDVRELDLGHMAVVSDVEPVAAVIAEAANTVAVPA